MTFTSLVRRHYIMTLAFLPDVRASMTSAACAADDRLAPARGRESSRSSITSSSQLYSDYSFGQERDGRASSPTSGRSPRSSAANGTGPDREVLDPEGDEVPNGEAAASCTPYTFSRYLNDPVNEGSIHDDALQRRRHVTPDSRLVYLINHKSNMIMAEADMPSRIETSSAVSSVKDVTIIGIHTKSGRRPSTDHRHPQAASRASTWCTTRIGYSGRRSPWWAKAACRAAATADLHHICATARRPDRPCSTSLARSSA